MLVAMFSAECTINDANIHSFLDVDLLVDGVAIPPTDGPESFCPPRPSFDQWTTARAVGVVELPPGGHVVSVRGRLDFFNAGDQWRLDDTSTVVLIPEPSGPWQLLPGLMLLAWLARRRARVAAGPLALIVLAIAPATSRAETNILHASNTTAQQFSDASSHALLLDGVNTTLVVAPTQAVRLVITYSAECTVSASDTFSWLEIDILLDGSEVNLGDDAFCTSHGVAALDEWLTVSRTIQVDIPAGLHVLGVAGILRNFNAGEQWRIDDAILSVLVIELP
jgi:hypothetical protein